MIRVSVDEVRPGMRLARTVYYEYGGVMLAAGATIGSAQIPRLKSFGMQSLYVYDEEMSDGIVHDYIDEKTRQSLTRNITHMFQNLREESRRVVTPEELHTGSLQEVRKRFDDDRMRSILSRARIKETFSEDVEIIVDGILANEELCLCVGTIKTNQSFLYDHSMEVTIHSAIIAKRLGFTRTEMKELLIGSLLHDIGYIFVPEDLLQKPTLTPRDEMLLQQHTTYGYFLLRDRPDIDLLSAHVAYQHHEQQDGQGYPRRLKGVNRILRPKDGRDTTGLVHRYADVVAVPNYYDSLVSTLPHRKAVPPDVAVRKLREGSGIRFNREVVDVFLSYLPVFPLGTQVKINQGEYTGSKAVVVHVDPKDLAKPRIRLLEDRKGKLSSPVELDLREREDIQINALWS